MGAVLTTSGFPDVGTTYSVGHFAGCRDLGTPRRARRRIAREPARKVLPLHIHLVPLTQPKFVIRHYRLQWNHQLSAVWRRVWHYFCVVRAWTLGPR